MPKTYAKSLIYKDVKCVGPDKTANEDISALIKILTPYADKWRSIGAQLGFKTHELGVIEAESAVQSEGPIAFLIATLQEWGKWPNSTLGVKHTTYANLNSLEAALSSPSVNLIEEGRKLREDLQNFKQGVSNKIMC